MTQFGISLDQWNIDSEDFAYSKRRLITGEWMVITMDGRFYLSHLA